MVNHISNKNKVIIKSIIWNLKDESNLKFHDLKSMAIHNVHILTFQVKIIYKS